MNQAEEPWMPGPEDMPWTVNLINPHGERHLGFNDREGRFYRLWQHRAPEPLHAADAILLRPSDIDQIIKFAVVWMKMNPDVPRSSELSDEIAAGAKAAVLHFAKLAQDGGSGRPRQTPPATPASPYGSGLRPAHWD
ncbi:hypothetical protein [Nonomuraea sp. NPDC003804]|uniref:hypothetical protein n=1 Tax=Nonomuraea sp. NPDC003804 TaxID=3154547 RepID=UPI0033A9BBBC